MPATRAGTATTRTTSAVPRSEPTLTGGPSNAPGTKKDSAAARPATTTSAADNRYGTPPGTTTTGVTIALTAPFPTLPAIVGTSTNRP